MSKNTVDVTDASFDTDVLQSDKTVLVDFWAEWCGPCKMVAPVLDEIAGENKDKLTVAKLDIDANPDAMRKYQIMSIPTMMVFQSGKLVKQIVRRQAEGRAASRSRPTTWADPVAASARTRPGTGTPGRGLVLLSRRARSRRTSLDRIT